jgi:hypothetical protein
MFFMIGLTDGRKDFPFTQTILCNKCGKYGRYQVFMTYMSLLLFFIPCARWNKHYYVQTTCCNTVYELNPEVGKRIARGEDVRITDDDLTQVYAGNGSGRHQTKCCQNCGYMTVEDFEYCPKCGKRF